MCRRNSPRSSTVALSQAFDSRSVTVGVFLNPPVSIAWCALSSPWITFSCKPGRSSRSLRRAYCLVLPCLGSFSVCLAHQNKPLHCYGLFLPHVYSQPALPSSLLLPCQSNQARPYHLTRSHAARARLYRCLNSETVNPWSADTPRCTA
jgi:hypothetical protein